MSALRGMPRDTLERVISEVNVSLNNQTSPHFRDLDNTTALCFSIRDRDDLRSRLVQLLRATTDWSGKVALVAALRLVDNIAGR